jgi:pyruvate kinase
MGAMNLPSHQTKIVATIGPASDSPEMLRRLMEAGMSIARLNFSHGDFDSHATRIARLREAQAATGRRLVIMADLPGPKIRLGMIEPDPLELRAGDRFTLTTREIVGNQERATITLPELPRAVHVGDTLYVNDGLIQLVVEATSDEEVTCRVAAGGELRSKKGVNLPGIALGLSAFTERDCECLAFAMQHGVDAVSQSFVERAADIEAVRRAAAAAGGRPFVIAKIERSNALEHIDEIVSAADGLMVARGDLGVEVPIAEVAFVQKRLIARANLAGKPIITATQMLESMVNSRLPTRAEATDVANAILDGTDAVMLSAESATGHYPAEAVAMLAAIAATAERHRPRAQLRLARRLVDDEAAAQAGVVASVVEHTFETVPCAAVFVPTRSGATARMISRYKPVAAVVAFSYDPRVCQHLEFSYGVRPVQVAEPPADWAAYAVRWAHEHGMTNARALLVTGTSERDPAANPRLEFLRL